jgi:hypothetical protein
MPVIPSPPARHPDERRDLTIPRDEFRDDPDVSRRSLVADPLAEPVLSEAEVLRTRLLGMT